MNNIPAFMKVDSTTCIIKRRNSDGVREMGEADGAFQTIASDVVCTCDAVGSWGRVHGGTDSSLQGTGNPKVFKLLVLKDQDILEGDKVTVYNVEYGVISIDPFFTHKEVMISKMT